MQALHQVQQEGGQALLGTHAAQQQHHAMFAHDLAAHDLVHVVLQGRDFAGQFFDAVERHDADLGILQRHRVTGVVVIHDAVQPDDLPRHLKACDLVAAVFGGHTGLEKTGADGVQGREGLAIAKQRATALDLAADSNDLVNALQLLFVQAHGHAQLAEVAVGAGDFDGERVHRHMGMG